MAKKKTTGKKNDEPKKVREVILEAKSEYSTLAGHYSNHIQVSMTEEEFVLDFLNRVGDQAIHFSRVFVSPAHAGRLMNLLERTLEKHKKQFPNTPLHHATKTQKKSSK